MKKVSLVFITFLLMINCLAINIQATEEKNIESTLEEHAEENVEYHDLAQENNATIEVRAKVVEVGEITEKETGTVKDIVQNVTIKIISEGEYKGEEYNTDYILSYDIDGKILAYELKKDDKVIVQLTKSDDGSVSATVLEYVRSNYIYAMFVLFLASIVLVGGKRGVKAIIGLLITVLAVYFILLKNIYTGSNVIVMSILTSMIIIVATFIVIGGINKKILTAALGTLGGVISAGVVALIFNYLAKMAGACEDAVQLSINMTTINFNFRDLLFAGIIISALGACMDVGMSIASSLDEIKMKNPDITGIELFKSGMNIGRDVIGTMTNTLILAYVGSSLTLILLFMACNMNIVDILNKETIAEQVISAIAGSMGVVYTVPITAIVYSILNKDKTIYRKVSENKIEGKRSLKI